MEWPITNHHDDNPILGEEQRRQMFGIEYDDEHPENDDLSIQSKLDNFETEPSFTGEIKLRSQNLGRSDSKARKDRSIVKSKKGKASLKKRKKTPRKK
jgi:hypothetical protein